MRLLCAAAGAALLCLTGCGDGKVVAVGSVQLDGRPLTNAYLTFIPVEGTRGPGGYAALDATGQFSALDPQGGKGILPGKYKVTVTRLPSAKPVEENAAVVANPGEALPAIYGDPEKTVLTAEVDATGTPIELRLDSKAR